MADNCGTGKPMTKKIAVAVFLFVLGVTFACAQSVAEVAKKEKERRAALKGKQTVVTNADLGKTKKKPAMTERVPEKTAEEAETGEEAAAPEGTPSETQAVEGEQAQAPSEAEAPPAEGETPPAEVEARPVEEPPAEEPGAELSREDFELRKSELEDAWNKAQEMVELLTLKMNGLWQEFYSLDDMQARDRIQQQISETYEKLLRAQDDETKIRQELDDFIANTPREGVPKIWIR